MKTHDHDRISRIFLEALDRPTGERAAFLDTVCADDPEARKEIEALLRHHKDPPGPLKTDHLGAPVRAMIGLAPSRIGPYEIEAVLGRGGMGVVYRGLQREPIHRRVAVKVLSVGQMSPQAIARFEAERQALALMKHPNVASVLDAGTTAEGLPYLAMEFVEGESITDFCDRHRLDVDRRLELFEQVCAGVQHAHQKAIIHRDIKPSNVLVTLVDGKPVPKLIDFGVAKIVDPRWTGGATVTRAGQFLGTPAYMSPEQAGLGDRDVDTRSDVYSLGALLYELLAGCSPFDYADLDSLDIGELRRRIRDEDPPTPVKRLAGLEDHVAETAWRRRSDPTRLRHRLAGDLQWIAMKALEKDGALRYASPSELAADVRRHMEYEPVSARPPSKAYRLRKFVRKHRAAVSAVAVTFLVLVGFTALQMVQLGRLESERDRADRQAEEAKQVTEVLVNLFNASPLQVRTTYADPRELLERVIERMDELDDHPVLQARLQHTIGRFYLNMGQYAEARPFLERSKNFLSARLGLSDPAVRDVMRTLARAYERLSLFGEAERLYDMALSSSGRMLGPHHLETLRSQRELGLFYRNIGRYDDAASSLEQNVAAMSAALGKNEPETMVSESLLAGVYLEQKRYAKAEQYLLDLRDRIGDGAGPVGNEALAVVYNLACANVGLGRKQEALVFLREAIENGFTYGSSILLDPHLKPLHGDPVFEDLVYLGRFNVARKRDAAVQQARMLRALGQPERAALLLEAVYHTARRLLGDGHPDVRQARFDFAQSLAAARRFDEAEPMLLEMLEDWNVDSVGHEAVGDLLWSLAQCDLGRGDRSRAGERFEEALRLYEAAYEDGAVVDFSRACVEIFRGKVAEGLERLSDSIATGDIPLFWLTEDLCLQRVRDDPGFRRLVARAEVLQRPGAREAALPPDVPEP